MGPRLVVSCMGLQSVVLHMGPQLFAAEHTDPRLVVVHMGPRLVVSCMGLPLAVLHMGPQLAVQRRDPGPQLLNFLATDLRNRSRHSRSSRCTHLHNLKLPLHNLLPPR